MQHFPPQTHEHWLAKVAQATGGAAFDGEGVLYQRSSGPTVGRPFSGPWKILARVDHADTTKALVQAQDDIANGGTGLVITSFESVDALSALPLHKLTLRNEAGDSGAVALQNLIGTMPLDPGLIDADFGAVDPDVAVALARQGFSGALMRGDGRPFHDAGLDDAQELGASLASAVACLRTLASLPDERLSHAVSMTLAATQNMFSTLAKFRSARILWKKVLLSCGLPEAPLALHGETSRIMLAAEDVHSNILREVAAAFGAVLGGADSFCVLPFSIRQGVPNGFARRVARNIQSILSREANLWQVADPAAGAGAFEHLTKRMCESAWRVMQDCERGHWPKGDAAKHSARPVIGVTAHRLELEPAADVEGAP